MKNNRINLCYNGQDVTGTCTVQEAANNPLFKKWYTGEPFPGKYDYDATAPTTFEEIGTIWYCDEGITSFRARCYEN